MYTKVSVSSANQFARPLVARAPISWERESYGDSDQNKNWNGPAMGFLTASCTLIAPQEAAASPIDEPVVNRKVTSCTNVHACFLVVFDELKNALE